jgi:hypothetical protein
MLFRGPAKGQGSTMTTNGRRTRTPRESTPAAARRGSAGLERQQNIAKV